MASLVVMASGAIAWGLTRDGDAGPSTGAAAGVAGASPPAVTPGSTDDAGGASTGGPATATTPTATPSPTDKPKRALVIHATGDVSLDPSYIPAFRSNGYGWAWSGLGGLFERDDLTIINHECPSTDLVAPIAKQFNFRCDPAALPAAKRSGVDVANLANNHGYDQGPQGILDSIRNVRRAGIVPVGAGANAEEADAPAYVEVGGWRIAVVGVGEVLDPLDQVAVGDRPGTAVGHDFARALRAIREADANADLVLVTIHWGVELDTQPRDYQVDEAERMIDAGADAIFGHHSHRLQPMDTYRGRPVFYGLGNFVWPNFSVEGSTTAVAEVTVTADGRIRGRLLPAFITSPGHPVLQ
jgi:poly-gamma-glutamate synthesis protein (capsule biosynthesis protein)